MGKVSLDLKHGFHGKMTFISKLETAHIHLIAKLVMIVSVARAQKGEPLIVSAIHMVP